MWSFFNVVTHTTAHTIAFKRIRICAKLLTLLTKIRWIRSSYSVVFIMLLPCIETSCDPSVSLWDGESKYD